MVIDTHAHLDLGPFDRDRDEVIRRARAAGVELIINPGVDLKSSQKAAALSQKYQTVYAAVGIQPEEVDQYFEDEPDPKFFNPRQIKIDVRVELEKLAKNKKVVAVGECGLDYKYIRDKVKSDKEELISLEKEKQKDIFRRQLGTAVLLDLPVVVHCREAEADVMSEILRYKETKKLRGVFHCFTGTVSFARMVLEAGFYISFTGIVTYPNAQDLRKVVAEIPLGKILVETDSPFLSPQFHRGQRNEPSFVPAVVEEIAQIKKLTADEVSLVTTENSRRLFRI